MPEQKTQKEKEFEIYKEFFKEINYANREGAEGREFYFLVIEALRDAKADLKKLKKR